MSEAAQLDGDQLEQAIFERRRRGFVLQIDTFPLTIPRELGSSRRRSSPASASAPVSRAPAFQSRTCKQINAELNPASCPPD